jgi:aspartate carbamoyltransferase catalytic subunit
MPTAQHARFNHWVSSADTTLEQVANVFQHAAHFEQTHRLGTSSRHLHPLGVVTTLFQENSTRTRLSFELAAQQLGCHVLHLPTQGSSLSKGETLQDTLATLAAMGARVAVLRHATEGLFAELAPWASSQGVSLVSGGEGVSDHPTQALLDTFTLARHWLGDTPMAHLTPERCHALFAPKTLAVVGHGSHSRVLRAHLGLAKALGWRIVLVAPQAWWLGDDELATWGDTLTQTTHLPTALHQCDAVMALRVQHERLPNTAEADHARVLADYVTHYQLSHANLPQGLPLLHPGPTNWGVELAEDLLHHPTPTTLIRQQVSNGVWVRMAVLHLLLSHQQTNLTP